MSKHWTPQRKREVVEVVEHDRSNLEKVATAYGLPADEVRDWVDKYERRGLEALSVTRPQMRPTRAEPRGIATSARCDRGIIVAAASAQGLSTDDVWRMLIHAVARRLRRGARLRDIIDEIAHDTARCA